ncbi:MAG: hypothetical protein JRH11_23370, partial [Deltaproteobacteria bacterium]|nr:hypothetical protein [Deltaproteobacteria bacterium]
MRNVWYSSLTITAACLIACGDSSGAAGGGGTEGDTAGSTTTATDDGGTGTATSVAPLRAPAVGIEVDWLEANQGIGVRVGQDGGGVGGDDRVAFLLQGREMLIRAMWKDPTA